LTAKRVLDEGVNVPEIETAYILASTTVERQWVQRRGRVLRKCRETNKEFATIHDFLVLPPTLEDLSDIDARNLIKQELRRVMEFASIARNAGKPGGAADTIDSVVRDYFGTGAMGV
jgi:superfamily II DNA or RNA helicase